jgi:hypothetical protein
MTLIGRFVSCCEITNAHHLLVDQFQLGSILKGAAVDSIIPQFIIISHALISMAPSPHVILTPLAIFHFPYHAAYIHNHNEVIFAVLATFISGTFHSVSTISQLMYIQLPGTPKDSKCHSTLITTQYQ